MWRYWILRCLGGRSAWSWGAKLTSLKHLCSGIYCEARKDVALVLVVHNLEECHVSLPFLIFEEPSRMQSLRQALPPQHQSALSVLVASRSVWLVASVCALSNSEPRCGFCCDLILNSYLFWKLSVWIWYLNAHDTTESYEDEGRPSLGPVVLEQRHAEGLSSLESDRHFPRVIFFTSKHRICHVVWISVELIGLMTKLFGQSSQSECECVWIMTRWQQLRSSWDPQPLTDCLRSAAVFTAPAKLVSKHIP